MHILITGIRAFVVSTLALALAFGWRPRTSLTEILSGVAAHHRQTPNWLDVSGNA